MGIIHIIVMVSPQGFANLAKVEGLVLGHKFKPYAKRIKSSI